MNISNPDPIIAAAATAAAALASAMTVVGQSAITDGIDPTTGWAGGIIVGGIAVFGFWFRYWSKGEAALNDDRRAADKRRDDELADLRRRYDDLLERYIEAIKKET